MFFKDCTQTARKSLFFISDGFAMKPKEGRQNPRIVNVRTSPRNMETIEILLH